MQIYIYIYIDYLYIQISRLIYFIRSFLINGLLQYFGNTSCHYQAKISEEKTNIMNSNT